MPTDANKPPIVPTGPAFLDALKTAPIEILKECCMGEYSRWIWLFPGTWFDYIPEGYVVTDIFHRDQPFYKDKASNDTRCGYLAYGIRRSTT